MNIRKYTSGQAVKEIKGTSAVFGRKHDISVEFGGEIAYTDGTTIHYPAVPEGTTFAPKEMATLRGFTDHETGHIVYSDFSIIPTIKRYMTRNNKPITMEVTNALEDMRIERRRMQDYAGARANLSAMGDHVNNSFLEAMKERGMSAECYNPLWVGPVAATWIGRESYAYSSTECISLLDDVLRDTIKPYIPRALQADSTKAVFELAKELEDKLIKLYEERKAEEPPKPPKGKDEDEDGDGECEKPEDERDDEPEGESEGDGNCDGESEDTDEGEDDDEEDSGQGDGEDEGEDDGDGEDSEDGDRTGEGEDGREDGGSDEDREVESGRPQWTEEAYNPEVNNSITTLIQKDENEVAGHGRTYKLGQNLEEKVYHWDDTDRAHYASRWPAHPYVYQSSITQTAGTTAVIRQRLSRAIMAQDKRGYETGLEQGRLDTRKLPSVMSGRTNVFKRVDNRHDVNTSVMLLVDMSGSMSGRKITLAQQCVISILESLEPTGVETAVMGFTTGMRRYNYARGEKTKAVIEGRESILCENTDLLVFKRFTDRLARTRNSVAAMEEIVNAWGGHNNDNHALNVAGDMLLPRPTNRKILITLSDGYANARGVDWYVLRNACHDTVGVLESSGIETVGIGIKDDAVSYIYPNYVVVRQLSDLAGEAMDKLSQLLLGLKITDIKVA